MESQLDHRNKLSALNEMGFKISLRLINIGLYGFEEIPISIKYKDVVNYIDTQLFEVNENTDDFVSLLCTTNFDDFEKTLSKLLEKDTSNLLIQKRKWRVLFLKELLENINPDPLQGLLEMLEFWTFMGDPLDSPHRYPSEKTKKDYFSKKNYEKLLKQNQNWLKEEINRIIKEEKIND